MFIFLQYIAMSDIINNKFELFKTIESTQEFFQWIPYDCKENILRVLWKDASSKSLEAMDDIPELESENYKIDKHLSVKQKLKKWWTRKKDPNGIEYLCKNLHKNFLSLWLWEVREYLSWVDPEFIWEQKFNPAAAQELWLKDKLPANYKEFEKMRWDNHQDFMQKYFYKNGKLMLSGYRDANRKKFFDIDRWENLLLWDGFNVAISSNSIGREYYNPLFGSSIRLVKGR